MAKRKHGRCARVRDVEGKEDEMMQIFDRVDDGRTIPLQVARGWMVQQIKWKAGGKVELGENDW